MSDRTFEEITAVLESRVNLERQRSFSLDGMEARLGELRILLKKLEHPEMRYRAVHVAGTKGKGSTCILLESVLREHGLTVGRYSSPHLYTVRERFTINGEICSIDDFTEGMGELCEEIQRLAPVLFPQLTYFELTTLFAFRYFAEKNIDIAVLETGMGGRLDATNVCRPELTLITSISFDHIEQLGPTLTDIAAEKGGIIKEGVPFLSTVCRPEVQDVLRNIAKQRNAPAYFLGEAFTVHLEPLNDEDNLSENPAFRYQTFSDYFPIEYRAEQLRLTMPGFHQIRNASLAAAAAVLLLKQTETQKLRSGLLKGTLPARVEIFPPADNKPAVIFDGSHNRSSVRALLKTVHQKFPNARIFMVFGISLGKDAEGMLTDLLVSCTRLVLTQYSDNPRAFPPPGLKTIVSSLPDAPQNLKNEFCMLATENGENKIMEDSVFLGGAFIAPLYAERVQSTAAVSSNNIQVEVIDDCRNALLSCLKAASPDDVICVAGSLFLAAELRKYYSCLR
ncbi:MAG: hypothetical protein LBN39_03610 [Planctomycetaceae bacterium]|jgi:dihydrofolate synthase/folylpolyglutamate synthase|nr:hypothetical protein [Planctomycetaceae bacterium]